MAENRLDYLRKQFTKIDEETFCKIIACDITPTKKYASWLLRLHSKSNLNLDNLNEAIQAIELFESLKDSLPVELRDINKFSNINTLLFSINSWLIKRFDENENKVSYLKNGAELLFENEDVFIVKILSFEGSVKYGSNTSWCTLQSSTFFEYSESGNLYIIECKTEKYQKEFTKKSQLHFAKTEYRNSKNNEINLVKIALKNPEIYKCFSFIKDVKECSNTDLYNFFNLNNIKPEKAIETIKRHGLEIISFLESLNKEILNAIFTSFGEEAYSIIPHSEEKLISFVSKVENGLKRLVKKGEYEISNEMIKESVKLFPENILLVDCEDEEIWKEVIEKESWLFKKSPFYKNVEKTFEVIMKVNEYVLNYINAVELFTELQREEIALVIINNACDNDLELLASLGELKETTQIKIVKKVPESIHYLVLPTEKTFKVQKEVLEKIKLKAAQEAAQEELYKKEVGYNYLKDVLGKHSRTYGYDDYNDFDGNGYETWSQKYGDKYSIFNDCTIMQEYQNDGTFVRVIRDKEGRVIKVNKL